LPAFLKCDPINDIQVLAPMRRFETGVDNLNVQLQKVLNKPGRSPSAVYRGTSFRAGDKVMQIRNNYQKMVFNGDIGRIVAVDQEEQEVRVAYPEPEGDRIVPYDLSELDEIVLSYAVSVHKSQGSEYPVVVMPVTTQHYIMLQRNLLYTAITRAKKMVVLVGTKKALFMAIKNNRIEDRRSLLALRIRQA
jgi:exodeoxyribonuclease V alpha subunit